MFQLPERLADPQHRGVFLVECQIRRSPIAVLSVGRALGLGERPHLSLGPGIPEPTAVFLPLQGQDRHSFAQDCKVVARAVLGGLHYEYRWERIAA
jgi:hypothetical protein